MAAPRSALTRTPAGKLRARGLGVPFDGVPGENNAITDVTGVAVGYATLIRGAGALEIGRGPVRTGVTAILPRGRADLAVPAFAGCHSLNGNGEMTGFIWIEEAGRLDGPITITNTFSCGLARDATLRWLLERYGSALTATHGLPVAAETFDGYLNDINGFHVATEDVFAALDGAGGGPLEEGSVGGGTGMICYDFKGGSGTASRRVELCGRACVLGVFVQANCGDHKGLTIAGVPVGRHLSGPAAAAAERTDGSIIAVVATDAPLLPHQLRRVAQRCGLGVARSGAVAAHGSGDIFLAFSTANAAAFAPGATFRAAEFLPDERIDPLFEAVVQATDEAMMNALVANETMTGRDGHVVPGLPHAEVRALLAKHGRLAE